ncbi:MAG: FAD-binding protein, partial [Rhodospirillaceae bacterium]|nr:FAD-binding protein [Rhodospirillaceae bacterium]
MAETLRPETPDQVLDAVNWAADHGRSFDVTGLASKHPLGRPMQATDKLDLSAINGVGLYEPSELVMTAAAATPLDDINAVLAENRQRLAFEPPNLSALLGTGGSGTIGGVFACNLSGPRRVLSGAARDHILGFHGVSGRGEHIKSGGRGVKNVTGFDLSKLMAGSFGTLALMTDISFKVLPVSEKSRTVLVIGVDATDAPVAMGTALKSPYEVSAAAHLPTDIAATSGVSYVASAGASVTAIRVEGPGPSVEFRCNALREMLAEFGDTEELHSSNTDTLWREIRDVSCFAGNDKQVWRLSVPPMDGTDVVARITDKIDSRALFDWGGGRIWLALDGGGDAAHETVREAFRDCGGHATLVRASD